VVTALVDADDDLPWHAHGLPPTRAGRRRFLGLDAPGASDAVVAYQSADRPLWYALRHLQRRAGSGDVAAGERDALLAALRPAQRLLVYLDRSAHGLEYTLKGDAGWVSCLPEAWTLNGILDAIGDDRAEARAGVDALLTVPGRARAGLELVRAAAASREPREPLGAALLDEIADDQLGHALDLLRAFPAIAVEQRLLGALRPLVDRALAEDRWQIGVDWKVNALAPLLGVAPSAQAARWMLALGCASGQPASVREAVGEHGGGEGIDRLLAEYDSLPEIESLPAARERTKELLGGNL
jgi:hypothetical protein